MSKPSTITEYIAAAPVQSQEKLTELWKLLQEAAPKTDEGIKWGTPALWYDRILFTFAGYEHHISLYPTPAVIKAFADKLTDYKTSVSTIQFPLDKPLPTALIREIAEYRVRDVMENDARWM